MSAKEAEMPKLILKLELANVHNTPEPLNPNYGDMQVFSDDIIKINNTPLAPGMSQHSGFCFFVRGPHWWLCQAGYTLPGINKKRFRHGGQIEARGLLDYSSSGPSFVAITGGTGDYRRATGHVKVGANKLRLTIYTP
jgi:hypothetical protein